MKEIPVFVKRGGAWCKDDDGEEEMVVDDSESDGNDL